VQAQSSIRYEKDVYVLQSYRTRMGSRGSSRKINMLKAKIIKYITKKSRVEV
jgi:hypothetical protein